jgi:probable DNA metabolism protein
MIGVQFEPSLTGWRTEARRLLQGNVSPDQILWPDQYDQSLSLFGIANEVLPSTGEVFRVPQEFLTMARFVACSRDPDRWSLLYRLLYRLKNETPHLLKVAVDADVQKGHLLMKSVTRDIHKMHAFVRFKQVMTDDKEVFMAWHRPEHLILEEAAPFFARRFGDKNWVLLTPDRTARWDGQQIHYSEGIPQHLFPHKDDFDELWKSYYSSIFNPARLKLKAMRAEMAPKYWSTLPEAEIIGDLIRQVPERLEKMAKNQNQQATVRVSHSLKELYDFADGCRACPLFATATHMVRGEGPNDASLMIVGEQPGDAEDLQGRPFVGPAGMILNEQLQASGILRENIYLTNAVKHFKFRQTDKVRLHQKPTGSEMHACRPWLEEEIKKVKPKVILALGATAATSVLGRLPKINQERGQIIRNSPYAEVVLISWHPAAILRASDLEDAVTKKRQLGEDLALAAGLLHRV